MRAASARALVLALLVLPLAAPAGPASAQAAGAPQWEYRVTVPDGSEGIVHVEVVLRNLRGIVAEMTFLTLEHGAPIVLDPSAPSTPRSTKPGGFGFVVDENEERFGFEVDVRRAAFREGEQMAWAGDDFALFKAESFALPFTYSYYGSPPAWRARIVFDAPDGWSAAAPWTPVGGDAFQLPPGEVLPRGYVALGAFDAEDAVEAGGKLVQLVRLGDVAPDPELDRAVLDYVDRATPFYEAVYGATGDRHLLVVTAPSPMFRGGLGAAGSIFLHESADLATLAHEYAHVHQRFATVETGGRASVWLAEGDAELHGALSLLVAGHHDAAAVRALFDDALRDRGDPALAAANLVNATYGTSLERFAYRKGLHVVHALDAAISRASGGTAGLPDLLRELNRRHAPGAEAAPTRVTNEEIREVAAKVAGADLAAFFDATVAGSAWPEPAPFEPRGRLTVADVALEATEVAPGQAVMAVARVVNSGTARIDRELPVLLDGARKDARAVRLEVAEAQDYALTVVLPAAGPHELTVGPFSIDVRGLEPARLRFDRTSVSPDTPYAKEDATLVVFVQNHGEQDGAASIELVLDGLQLAASPHAIVPAGATEAIALTLRLDQPGERQVLVRVQGPDRLLDERVVTLRVQPADRDRDGTPDDEDAYPLDPKLREAGLLSEARHRVPAPGFATLLLLGLALAAMTRPWAKRR